MLGGDKAPSRAAQKGAGLGLKNKTHRMKSYLLLLALLGGISGVA